MISNILKNNITVFENKIHPPYESFLWFYELCQFASTTWTSVSTKKVWWYMRFQKYVIYFDCKKKRIVLKSLRQRVFIGHVHRSLTEVRNTGTVAPMFLLSPSVWIYGFFSLLLLNQISFSVVSLSEEQFSLFWWGHGHLTFHDFSAQTFKG